MCVALRVRVLAVLAATMRMFQDESSTTTRCLGNVMMLKHRDPARRDALKSLRLTLGSDAPRSRRRALTVTVFGKGIGLGDRLANQATIPHH